MEYTNYRVHSNKIFKENNHDNLITKPHAIYEPLQNHKKKNI